MINRPVTVLPGSSQFPLCTPALTSSFSSILLPHINLFPFGTRCSSCCSGHCNRLFFSLPLFTCSDTGEPNHCEIFRFSYLLLATGVSSFLKVEEQRICFQTLLSLAASTVNHPTNKNIDPAIRTISDQNQSEIYYLFLFRDKYAMIYSPKVSTIGLNDRDISANACSYPGFLPGSLPAVCHPVLCLLMTLTRFSTDSSYAPVLRFHREGATVGHEGTGVLCLAIRIVYWIALVSALEHATNKYLIAFGFWWCCFSICTIYSHYMFLHQHLHGIVPGQPEFLFIWTDYGLWPWSHPRWHQRQPRILQDNRPARGGQILLGVRACSLKHFF